MAKERTVVTQLKAKSLCPRTVVIPAAVKEVLKVPFTFPNIATDAADAARRNIVASVDVMMPVAAARGIR